MNHTESKLEIMEAINKMTFYSDRRDFAGLGGCYCDTICQYDDAGTILSSQSRDQLIAGAAETLPGYDMLMHLLTNHQVELITKEQAKVTVNMYCIHAIGQRQMINCSRMTAYMICENGRWMIHGTHSEFIKQFGDPDVFETAKRRTAEMTGIYHCNCQSV